VGCRPTLREKRKAKKNCKSTEKGGKEGAGKSKRFWSRRNGEKRQNTDQAEGERTKLFTKGKGRSKRG